MDSGLQVGSIRQRGEERKEKEREGRAGRKAECTDKRYRTSRRREDKAQEQKRLRNEDTLCPDDYLLQVSRLFLYFTYFTISFFNALSSRSVPLCPRHDKVKHAVKVRRKGNGKD